MEPHGRANPPLPVRPSRWRLPDPAAAGEDLDESGFLAVGADLEVETLVDAYRHGVFPWPHPGVPLPWFSPDPRAVIDADQVHVSRSLRRWLRHCGWETTVDADFERVVAACADRPRGEGTWVTREMRRAYTRLHRKGWAHSLEVWDGDVLVGGIYGVRVGRCLTGESMFHRATNGSKVALVDLCRRWAEAGGVLVDVQIPTEHLLSMGAREVPRSAFLAQLAQLREEVVCMVIHRLPVSRLAPAP
jgi:leucyl/phenylalanyl-tRNA--protein transferase